MVIGGRVVVMLHRVRLDLMVRIEAESEAIARMVLHHRKRSRSLGGKKKKRKHKIPSVFPARLRVYAFS